MDDSAFESIDLEPSLAAKDAKHAIAEYVHRLAGAESGRDLCFIGSQQRVGLDESLKILFACHICCNCYAAITGGAVGQEVPSLLMPSLR